MSQQVIHATLASTFVLISIATSCGVTSDADVIETETVGQALAVADFTIGSDTPIAEQYHSGNYPSIAAGGDQRLAVFEDGARIRGVRFDKAGSVLDMPWLDFGIEGHQQLYPAVAFGLDRYLVVWSEYDDPASTIYGQIVTLDGQLLAEPTPLASGFDAQVCWLGDSFVVSWTDSGVNLARVDVNGALIANSAVKVSTQAVTSATRPVVATSDTMGVVAFSEDDGTRRNIRVARFTPTGEVLDPGGVVVNPSVTGTSEYALATTNEHTLLTFKDEASLLKGSVMLADGSLGATEFEIVASSDVAGHTVGADGTNFAVVWDCPFGDVRQLCAKTVAADGTIEGGETSFGSASNAYQAMYMDITFDQGTYAIVYPGEGVWAQQVETQLEADSAPLPLSALPNAQNMPFGAWDGTHYVVSWNDERAEGFQARAVRISKDGRILDPEGIAVSPADQYAYSSASASNAAGITAFVWSTDDQTNAYLRTLNSDGALSELSILASTNPEGVNIVSNGTTFLVGYQVSPEPSSQVSTLYVHPLNEAGVPQGEPIPIVPEFSRPRVGLAVQGQDYLVSYSGQTQETGAALDGKLLRVSASGEVLAELEAPSAGNPYYTTGTAPNGTVVFGWNNYETPELWFRILSGDTWNEATLLTTQPSEEAPAFGWNGEQFVSVWVEDRNALWTREVALDGTLGEESVAVSGDHTSPKLTLGIGPELLLTSVHWELFSRTRRIESRFVGADGIVLPSNPIELDSPGSTSDVATTTGTNTNTSAPIISGTSNATVTAAPSASFGTTTAPASTSTAGTSAPPVGTSTPTSAPSSSTTSEQDEPEATETETQKKKSSDGCAIGVPSEGHSPLAWLSVSGLLAVCVRFRRRA